jgi:hypothetical protein
LLPSDFTGENLPLFVNSVLDFQYTHIHKSLNDEYREIVDYLKMDALGKPIFLISPYFYLSKNSRDWTEWKDINLRMIDASIQKKKSFNSLPVYALLVIDRHFLDNSKDLNKLVESYSIADGLLYWIDSYNETEASLKELKTVINMVKNFKRKYPSKSIMSLYGGYFSQLLLKEGLDGVVHGLEYGENRDVVPVGGGIPLSKYYLPAVKKRIPANTMISLLKKRDINTARKFHASICNCRICKDVIKTDKTIEDFNNFIKSRPILIKYNKTGRERIREIEFPLTESRERCLFHYLEVKAKEFLNIRKSTKEELLNDLGEYFVEYRTYLGGDEDIEHLERWKSAFSDG